jgi:uncharacterized coiled-coil protein SlyX
MIARSFTAAAFLLALLLPRAAAPGSAGAAEARQDQQKRIDELEKQVAELSRRVKELEDYLAQLKAMGARAMTVGMVAANERNAAATIKTIAAAEADFRANDRDVNHVNDFWVGDVSGLYRYRVAGQELKLIEQVLAAADASPLKLPELSPLQNEKPIPKAGYLYTVLAKGVEDGNAVRYHSGGFRHNYMFGFAAFPAAYPASGRSTFIINEHNHVWKKDLGGKFPEVFPADPGKDGWEILD